MILSLTNSPSDRKEMKVPPLDMNIALNHQNQSNTAVEWTLSLGIIDNEDQGDWDDM
jgi:hypothetical protein